MQGNQKHQKNLVKEGQSDRNCSAHLKNLLEKKKMYCIESNQVSVECGTSTKRYGSMGQNRGESGNNPISMVN